MKWLNWIAAGGTGAAGVAALAVLLGTRDTGLREIGPGRYERFVSMVEEAPGLRCVAREMLNDGSITEAEFTRFGDLHAKVRTIEVRRQLARIAEPPTMPEPVPVDAETFERPSDEHADDPEAYAVRDDD
jgi:hypothetical protein